MSNLVNKKTVTTTAVIAAVLLATGITSKAFYDASVESANKTSQAQSVVDERPTLGDTLSVASGADASVTSTKDGIKITKSASWTTYSGQAKDSAGNPYVKIDFEIETSVNSSSNTGGNSGNSNNQIVASKTADVMLVVDRSESMGLYEKLDSAKAACNDLVNELFKTQNISIRMGLATLCKTGALVQGLDSNKASTINAVNGITMSGGTNIQAGIYQAQTALRNSTADIKVMVVLTDGASNYSMEEVGPDIATYDTVLQEGDYSMIQHEETAINQSKIAKQLIPNLKIITIGYDTPQTADNVLQSIADRDDTGKLMFYHAGVEAAGGVLDLAGVFGQVTEDIRNQINSSEGTQQVTQPTITSVQDIVPSECSVIESTISSDSTMISPQLSADKKTITWQYQQGNIGQNIHKLSFIMKVNMDSISTDYLLNSSQIWTNGSTIDINKSSAKSAWLVYGNSSIELSSPKLSLPLIKPEASPDTSATPGTSAEPSATPDVSSEPGESSDPTMSAEPIESPTPEPTPIPAPDPIIDITSGEDIVINDVRYKLFYMYFIDNKYRTVEDINFSIKTEQENATTAQVFFGGPKVEDGEVEVLNNELIKLLDSDGKAVPCVNNRFTIELNKEYIIRLNAGYFINQVLEEKADYTMNAIVNDKINTKNIRLLKRESFAMH